MKEKGRRKKDEDEVADLRTRTKEFALRIIRLYSGASLIIPIPNLV